MEKLDKHLQHFLSSKVKKMTMVPLYFLPQRDRVNPLGVHSNVPRVVVELKVVVVEVRVVVFQYKRNLPFLSFPEASMRPESSRFSSRSNSSAKISSSSFSALKYIISK